ncbi:MAG: dicarboxylate/amino acid:cation symporter [Gemmatimonadota bacterium]|nr:dicarboxylate/amino acid:cation symporter [Gemmatimonadota bacterium]
MSFTTRVLIGLVLGLLIGIALSLYQGDAAFVTWIPAIVEPIGSIWVNAIRMTVVPLVVSLLMVTIAGEGSDGVASLGARTMALFGVMVAVGCAFTVVLAPPLLGLIQIDPATAQALRETTASAAVTEVGLPPFRDWLVGLVPSNPLAAAVDGAMLPLIVFTAIFAFAARRIPTESRDALVGFFRSIRDAMFVVIEWVLALAPIGVFALMLPLAARMGATAAGAMGYAVVVACGLILLATAGLYPIAVAFGRIGLRDLARALGPVQAVGFSTRSSLASLPAMFAAVEQLKLRSQVSGMVLPVAVSVFKWSSPIGRTTGTYFVAMLYGIQLGPAEYVAIAGAIGLLSFYSPGIPSGGLLVMTPVYMSLGLPIEGIGILIALDLVVDMFITVGNVTADVVAAVFLTRADRGPAGSPAGTA